MKLVHKVKRFIEMSLLILFLLLISINPDATVNQHATSYVVDK